MNGVFALNPGTSNTWYGLAGANILWASDTDIGLNLGAGTDFELLATRAYFEAKYVFGSREGLCTTLGIRF